MPGFPMKFARDVCEARQPAPELGAHSVKVLDMAGFVADATNSNKALFTLSLTYALIPCLIKLAAALMLWFAINQGDNNEETSNTNLNRSEPSAQ